MKEIIYGPIMNMLSEQRPGWQIIFENDILKIRTNGKMVDREIVQQIQDLEFMIDEIFYHENWGIVFSIVETGLR